MESRYLLERRQKALGTKIQPKTKPKTPIKRETPDMAKLHRQYRKMVAEMIVADKRCEIKSPVCTKIAQGLHHKQKRSKKNLLDRANVVRACNACNTYVEEHSEWALENGFTISKF